MNFRIERIKEELQKSLAQKAEWEKAQKWNLTHLKVDERKQVDSKFVRAITLERIASLESKLRKAQ